jgi:hypothetical protein
METYQILPTISCVFLGLNAYRGISPFDMPFQRYDKLQVCCDANLSLFH